MNVGTKSILFGVHQFFIHPWFVAWVWWRLYGFPWDPRLWVVFFVHDLGYWGKPNMDGPEGERHVELGARIVHVLFDWPRWVESKEFIVNLAHMLTGLPRYEFKLVRNVKWQDLCLYHSRVYAKENGKPFSRLCIADKLLIALTPTWLYLLLANMTGEIKEYMAVAYHREGAKYAHLNLDLDNAREWHKAIREFMRLWVEEHKDGRADLWTPDKG